MEQMTDWMLAKMDSFQEEMRTNQDKMGGQYWEGWGSSRYSHLLGGIYHARTEFTQEEWKPRWQEKTNLPTLDEAPLGKQADMSEMLKDIQWCGVIEESDSPWSSPIIHSGLEE